MEKILLRDSPKKISYYASCLQIPKVRICLVIKKFIVTNRAKLADGCFLAFRQNHNDFFCHKCQVHLKKTLPLTYSSDKLVTQLTLSPPSNYHWLQPITPGNYHYISPSTPSNLQCIQRQLTTVTNLIIASLFFGVYHCIIHQLKGN